MDYSIRDKSFKGYYEPQYPQEGDFVPISNNLAETIYVPQIIPIQEMHYQEPAIHFMSFQPFQPFQPYQNPNKTQFSRIKKSSLIGIRKLI